MNSKFLTGFFSLVAFLPIATVEADQGLALAWKSGSGYWFACGPVRCIQAGVRTEKEELDYVLSEGRHSASYFDNYGRC